MLRGRLHGEFQLGLKILARIVRLTLLSITLEIQSGLKVKYIFPEYIVPEKKQSDSLNSHAKFCMKKLERQHQSINNCFSSYLYNMQHCYV